MDPSQTAPLNRLLTRLDHSLHSDPQRLQTSQFERNRVRVNIEHARTMLLTAEKQSSTIRIQSQRTQAQKELQGKRELVRRLNERLRELEELDRAGDDEDSEDEEERAADQAAMYAPAREADSGLDAGEPQAPPPDLPSQQQQQSHQSQNELRSRKPLSANDNRSAASTTARDSLFAGRKQHPDLETTESLLSHNRTEAETLTNGLIGLARALKESSVNFGRSLEEEKEVLKRAEGGLEKSSLGMEAAERRMGMLRRMSEGQGWWGRIKLYGFIAGLWVVCFLVVFVGPKLRF